MGGMRRWGRRRLDSRDQTARGTARRYRIAVPAKPKPSRIINQVLGSGIVMRSALSGAKSLIWLLLPVPTRGQMLKPYSPGEAPVEGRSDNGTTALNALPSITTSI